MVEGEADDGENRFLRVGRMEGPRLHTARLPGQCGASLGQILSLDSHEQFRCHAANAKVPLPSSGVYGTKATARLRRRFVRDLHFAPDPFQLEAFDALDGGSSVLVSAPTGSGKTLVAEYAICQTLARGTKAFYTTPLKALSNQKYPRAVRRPRRGAGGPADRGHRASAPVRRSSS